MESVDVGGVGAANESRDGAEGGGGPEIIDAVVQLGEGGATEAGHFWVEPATG